MRIVTLAVLAAAALALAIAPAAAGCSKRTGEGWGGSIEMAKFQSFEIIEQVTGNWPFGHKDDLRILRQNCKADGGGYTCRTTVSVCAR